jgi:RNA polymerase sigma-70 factor (ECF subfamily)
MAGGRPGFPATDRTLLQRLLEAAPETRRQVLDSFCRTYWRPVYFHVRVSWSRSREDAKDLTQGFFARLMEDGTLRRYASHRGSLRNFIKELLRQFILDSDKSRARLKRGGGKRTVRVSPEMAGARPAADRDSGDRLWVEGLMTRAVERVRASFASAGRVHLVRVFEEYELADPDPPTYREVAARLGMTEGDVRYGLHAVRQAIRREVLADLRRRSADEEEFQRALFELLDG